jgi:hypothetical protein
MADVATGLDSPPQDTFDESGRMLPGQPNEYGTPEAASSVVDFGESPDGISPGMPNDSSGDAVPELASPDEPLPDSGAKVDSSVNPELESAILALIDEYDNEEQMALESRARLLKLLDYYWQGVQNIFWNDTVGNYSVPQSIDLDDNEELPKIINIYKPYGEAIIAALSASVPKVRFFPEDADSEEDVLTAATFTKAAKKIQKDNGSEQLLAKSLFILWNQHFVAAYIYPETDAKYGKYSKSEESPIETQQDNFICPQCGNPLPPPINPAFGLGNQSPDSQQPPMGASPNGPQAPPDMSGGMPGGMGQPPPEMPTVCQNCGFVGLPYNDIQVVHDTFKKLKEGNKTRICIDLYGSLNVYFPAWVKSFKDSPYLAFDEEKDEAWAIERYQNKKGEISAEGDTGQYQRWARLPQIVIGGTYALVTIKKRWYRPFSYNRLSDDKVALLKGAFPDGLCATKVNDILVEYKNEDLEDCWAVTENPIYNSIYSEPQGRAVVDIQDMISDNVNISSDTIRYGVPITFVRSDAIDTKKLEQTRARPGDMVAAKPASGGGSLNDQFFQTQMARLSEEVPGFQKQLEQYGQFVSGAYASIYGGAIQGGGGTLGEYETSRNQSLQRLQLTWRMVSNFFIGVLKKGAYQYFDSVDYDEVMVEPNGNSFKNTYIKLTQATGKVGQVEAEFSDQFPASWVQQRDIIQNLLTLNNDQIGQVLGHFKNAPMLNALIGVPELYIPGQDDVDKQLYEIGLLVQSQPNQQPMTAPNGLPVLGPDGQPQMGPMIPSVAIDPSIDDDEIHIGVCKIYLKSPEGLASKGTPGYQNVEAHLEMHLQHQQMLMMQQMQMQAMMGPQGPPQKQASGSKPEEKSGPPKSNQPPQ